MDKVTIKTLSKDLGFSIATISKALRNSHDISAETKQKVQDLAKKLNYIPNPYASSLRRRKSKTIAVVLPEVADSFFAEALNGIESVAQINGYHVLVYLTQESFLKEKEILKNFQSGRVDGILMSISSETTNNFHIQELRNNGIPIVFFDRVCEDVDTAKITTDDFESSYKATQHLIECGCKQIILLSISKSLSISNKRMEGYMAALKNHHILCCDSNIIYCSNDDTNNFELIKKAMQYKDRPDGIISTVEKFTTSIYLACKELNIAIPQDVKVVCFSNMAAASILNPSLTTITQPAFEIGKCATTILCKALEKPNFNLKNESLIIPSSLIVRESTVC